MSIYYCQHCDRYVDNDQFPGEPRDGELVCPRCFETPDEEIHRINKELAEMRVRSMKRSHLNQLIGE